MSMGYMVTAKTAPSPSVPMPGVRGDQSPLTTQCSGHWSHWSLVPEQQILSSDPTLCQLCQQYAEHRKH